MKNNAIDILYEDNHLVAVNKPAGVPVQGDDSGDKPLIEHVSEYIKTKYNKKGEAYLGLVHRIDRPVSGVVLFARTSKALTRMNEIFQRREVKKIYLAIVGETPSELSGTLQHYLVKDTKQNKTYAYAKARRDTKKAILKYELIGQTQKYALLRIDLETGRHHQIRCQLAKIGSPVKGDLKYGFPRSNPNGGIGLHSYILEFEHPIKKTPITITAPPPNDDRLWIELRQVIASHTSSK